VTVVAIVLLWAAIVGTGFALSVDADRLRVVGVQALLYVGMAWWLGRRPEVAGPWARTPRGTRVGLLLILAAMVAAQLAGRNTLTFPFVRWDMYGRRVLADPTWVELTGVTADGGERPLNVSRTLPALSRRITTGLARLMDRLDTERDAAEIARLEATYAATVRSLATGWAAKHPGVELRTVRAWRVTVPTNPYRGPDTVVRELYREVQIQ
jgi:hypothetical protein